MHTLMGKLLCSLSDIKMSCTSSNTYTQNRKSSLSLMANLFNKDSLSDISGIVKDREGHTFTGLISKYNYFESWEDITESY